MNSKVAELLRDTCGHVVVKRNRNATLNSKYADFADVVDALTPFLKKHGACFHFPSADIEGEKMRVSLGIAIGSECHVYSYDVGIPEHNRGTSRAMASGAAMSYGCRYALVLCFGLVTGDDDDAERASRDFSDRLDRDSAPVVRAGPELPPELARGINGWTGLMDGAWKKATMDGRPLESMKSGELAALWDEFPDSWVMLAWAADFCGAQLAKRGMAWGQIDGGEDPAWPADITGVTPDQLRKALRHLKNLPVSAP